MAMKPSAYFTKWRVTKLWLGSICPVVCFSVAHELKTSKNIFMRLKKVKRKSVFYNMRKLYGVLIFINANQVLMDQSHIYHLGVCNRFLLHFQSWKATTGTVCPTNPKIYVSHKNFLTILSYMINIPFSTDSS